MVPGAAKWPKKAVVLLPHWNAPVDGHNALCRGLARLGISALRISLPYHDYRMPAELKRADYAVSSNICRTMDAARQAVIDVRCCFDWLQLQGFERLGIVGTSLGSAYACLVSAHDAAHFRKRVQPLLHAMWPTWCGPAFPPSIFARAWKSISIWTGCGAPGWRCRR